MKSFDFLHFYLTKKLFLRNFSFLRNLRKPSVVSKFIDILINFCLPSLIRGIKGCFDLPKVCVKRYQLVNISLFSHSMIRNISKSNEKPQMRSLFRSTLPKLFLGKGVLRKYAASLQKNTHAKHALQLYSNHTSAWVLSCKFANT